MLPTYILYSRNGLKEIFGLQGDRIVYVGKRMPTMLEGTEVLTLPDKKIVPGYIEPHVHPFQLYNPQTFADYAAR